MESQNLSRKEKIKKKKQQNNLYYLLNKTKKHDNQLRWLSCFFYEITCRFKKKLVLFGLSFIKINIFYLYCK